jgi:hypothetical protein
VPLTELLPFYDQFPAAVIAIVAKNNSREGEDRLPLLLKAEEGKNSIYWYAAVSLVDRKQLVHYLVQQARFDYAISVLDEDFVPVQIREGPPRGVSGGVGGIIGGIPNGSVAWPEATIYHIELWDDIEDLLTSGTWRSTYFQMHSPPTHWHGRTTIARSCATSIAHCAVCQFDRGDFPNIRGGKASIVWHSLEQARSMLEEAVERYVKECVRMIDALHETTVSEP